MQAVSRRTGVPAPTIRAWERRYGVPRPGRSAGRQRLYSDDDIRLIEWLRAQAADGVRVARAVELWREGLAAQPAPQPGAGEPPEWLAEVLLQALLRQDLAGAESTLTRALALYDPDTVAAGVIRPALVEIGDRWHRGEVEIAVEHLASQMIRNALGSLLRLVMAEHDGPMVLVAAAPGERHELGALMVAIAAARRGLRVRFLGADVPADSLARVVAALRPAAVVLSATMEEHVGHLAEAAGLLARSAHAPAIAFGGRGFERRPQLAANIPGALLDPDLGRAATQLRALVANGPGAR
jgi:DNA-binding transcriptional MerR regulator